MQTVDETFTIIQSQAWKDQAKYKHANSIIVLLQEHLRSMIIWRRYLDLQSTSIWYLNVAQSLEPNKKLPTPILTQLAAIEMPSIYVKAMCINIMLWANLDRQKLETIPESLPMPYKAAITMLNRGGSFTVDKSHIEISAGGQLITTFALGKFLPQNIENPILNLSLESLDEIDKSPE